MAENSKLALEISSEWMEKISNAVYITEGAISKVYKAQYNDTAVAIKTPANREKIDTFKREASNLKALHDSWKSSEYANDLPVMPELIADGTGESQPFIIMEWVEGEKIVKLLESDEKELEEKDAIALMYQFGKLLVVLHSLGRSCSDIKFENLWKLNKDYEGRPCLMVTDWNVLNESPTEDDFHRDLSYASYFLYKSATCTELETQDTVLRVKRGLDNTAFQDLTVCLQEFISKALSPLLLERYQTAKEWVNVISVLNGYWFNDEDKVLGDVQDFIAQAEQQSDLMKQKTREQKFSDSYQIRSDVYYLYKKAENALEICTRRNIRSEDYQKDIQSGLQNHSSELIRQTFETDQYTRTEIASEAFAECARQSGNMDESQYFWRWHLLAKIAYESKVNKFLDTYPSIAEGVEEIFHHNYDQAQACFSQIHDAFKDKPDAYALVNILVAEADICSILKKAKASGDVYEEGESYYKKAADYYKELKKHIQIKDLNSKIIFCWTEAPNGVDVLKESFEKEYANKKTLKDKLTKAKEYAQEKDWDGFNQLLVDTIGENSKSANVSKFLVEQIEDVLKAGDIEAAYKITKSAWFTPGMQENIGHLWGMIRALHSMKATLQGDQPLAIQHQVLAEVKPVEFSPGNLSDGNIEFPSDITDGTNQKQVDEPAVSQIPEQPVDDQVLVLDAFLTSTQEYLGKYLSNDIATGKAYLNLVNLAVEKAMVYENPVYAYKIIDSLLPLEKYDHQSSEIKIKLVEFVRERSQKVLEKLEEQIQRLLSESEILPTEQAVLLLDDAMILVKRAENHLNSLEQTNPEKQTTLKALFEEVKKEQIITEKKLQEEQVADQEKQKKYQDQLTDLEAKAKTQRQLWQTARDVFIALPPALVAIARQEQEKEVLDKATQLLLTLDQWQKLASKDQQVASEIKEIELLLESKFDKETLATFNENRQEILRSLKDKTILENTPPPPSNPTTPVTGSNSAKNGRNRMKPLLLVVGLAVLAILFFGLGAGSGWMAYPAFSQMNSSLIIPSSTLTTDSTLIATTETLQLTPVATKTEQQPAPTLTTPPTATTPAPSPYLLDDTQKAEFLKQFPDFPPNMEAIYVVDSSQATFLPTKDSWEAHPYPTPTGTNGTKTREVRAIDAIKFGPLKGQTISVTWPVQSIEKSGYYAVWFEDTKQFSGTGDTSLEYKLFSSKNMLEPLTGSKSAKQVGGGTTSTLVNVGVYKLVAGESIDIVLDISKITLAEKTYVGVDRIVVARLPTLESEGLWSLDENIKSRQILFWEDDSTQLTDTRKPADGWDAFTILDEHKKEYVGENAQKIDVTKDNVKDVSFTWQFPYVQGAGNFYLAVMVPVGLNVPIICEVYVDNDTNPKIKLQIPVGENHGKPAILDQHPLILDSGPHTIKVVVTVWGEQFKEDGEKPGQLVVDAVMLLLKQ